MTTTGVKPKMISNIIAVMLLFLFVSPLFASHVWKLSGDTLILDGEVIEIEKREEKTNIDSLQEVLNNDQKEPNKQWRYYAGAEWSIGAHLSELTYNNSGFTELADFLGDKYPAAMAMGGSLKAGIDISDYVSVYGRFFYGNYLIKGAIFDESSLSPDELRSAFETSDGRLFERYVVFIDPGFEERIEERSVNEYRIGIRSWSLGLNARFYLTGRDKPQTPFVDLGLIHRDLKMEEDETVFGLNSSGEWTKTVISKDQGKQKSWMAQMAVGYLLEMKRGHLLEASLFYEGLPREVYNSTTSERNSSVIGLRLGYSFSFFQ